MKISNYDQIIVFVAFECSYVEFKEINILGNAYSYVKQN